MPIIKSLKGARYVYLGSIFISFFNLLAFYAFTSLQVTVEYLAIHAIVCLLALNWWKKKQLEFSIDSTKVVK